MLAKRTPKALQVWNIHSVYALLLPLLFLWRPNPLQMSNHGLRKSISCCHL